MEIQDTAAFALRPLLSLRADGAVTPGLAAEGVLHWLAQDEGAAWGSTSLPPAGVRDRLVAVGLVEDGDPAPQALSDLLLAREPLWSVRLLLRLGRRAQASALAATLPAEHAGWRSLLLAHLDGTPLTSPPSSIANDGPPGPLLLATATAALARAAPGAERDRAAQVLRRVAAEVVGAGQEPAVELVVRARVAIATESGAAHTGALREECEDFPDLAGPGPGFLVREVLVRLLLLPGADSWARAERAVEVDPHGAATLLAAARVAVAHGHVEAARSLFRSAARHGVDERHAALTGLLDLVREGDPADDPSLVGAVADLLTRDPEPPAVRHAALHERRALLADTAAADLVRTAAAAATAAATAAGSTGSPGSTGSAGRLPLHPLPIERYRPFLDLTMPAGLDEVDVPPVSIHMPLLAHAAVVERREPWFAEIHPQRATAVRFRTDLARTAMVLGHASAATSEDVDTWLHAEDGCPADVRERFAGAADQPLLERALLARLAAAVGFYPFAQGLLPGPDVPAGSPEASFALATWIYTEQLMTNSTGLDLEPRFHQLRDSLTDDPRCARMRVVVSANATVHAFHLRRPERMPAWRAYGETALAAYRALPEVDEFDADVLTSRWYRAVGFLPFMTGDRDGLIADMDAWLGIATGLVGHDHRTRVMAADNYFPAVETAIRTHAYLGNHDVALRLVDKFAAEIDPVEPKTWLTAGELRHRAGDVRGALAAYERAAHLQFPNGRLTWFNAGQCHEQLGHADEAVECYRRCLEHWPRGSSPVRRVRDLVATGALGRDSALLLAAAQATPAWSHLPPPPPPA